MAAKIRVIPAQAPSFEVPVQFTATIGRTPENTVCLGFSPTVSRQHAVVRCHNGYEYQLMDLGSRNGTYVNNQRVVLPVTLQHGALIRIANNDLIFEQKSDPAAAGDGATVTLAGTVDPNAPQAIRHAAILICDIRGFTTQSETLPAGTLAQQLGEWFREAGNLVQKQQGIVDKFIGDAILAYWQEQPGLPHECERALNAARHMLELADRKRWPESGKPFNVGVALHYGRVGFGHVGFTPGWDATIIGNTVNTAFRLETVMKELNQKLLLSEQTYRALAEDARAMFTDLGERTLRGKNESVRVFGLKNP